MTAIGRQVAIGRSQAAEARLIVTRNEGASSSVAWRNNEVAWNFHEFTEAGWGADLKRIRAVTNQLWFMMAGGDGIASRTKDGGATWDETYTAPTQGSPDGPRMWRDFAITTDGVLWGLTMQDFFPTDHVEIWKSTDDGDNWEEMHDAQVSIYRLEFLVPHPTDPGRIAAYGTHDPLGQGRKPLTIFSIDGGDSWNANAAATLFPLGAATFNRSLDIKQLTSNRFVLQNVKTANGLWAFWTSDDNGATWVERTSFSAPSSSTTRLYSIVGEKSGAALFSYYRDELAGFQNRIVASYDGGVTWADIENDIPSGGSPGQGIVYDPVEKAIYTFGTGEGQSDNDDHIWKLFPVASTGVWQEVGGQLVPFDGDATYNVGTRSSHGIAVIPRP